MILTIETIKKYLPSNTIDKADKFEAFESRALNKYFPRFLGDKLFQSIKSESPDQELIDLIIPPLVNLTYLESIPFLNLVLTSTGYGVVSNPNVAPASMERIKDLKDACLMAANDGIDQMLWYLETEKPSDWNKCSLNESGLIKSSSDFTLATGIFISRFLFIHLVPYLQLSEIAHLKSTFSKEFIEELKGSEKEDLVKSLIVRGHAFSAAAMFLEAPALIPQNTLLPNAARCNAFAGSYFSQALSYLAVNLDNYATYQTHGYEAPYDNNDKKDDSSFFIGGITA